MQTTLRLMLSVGFDVTTADYTVGYGNAVQFTCVYKRLFGTPLRDIKQLRKTAAEGTADFCKAHCGQSI